MLVCIASTIVSVQRQADTLHKSQSSPVLPVRRVSKLGDVLSQGFLEPQAHTMLSIIFIQRFDLLKPIHEAEHLKKSSLGIENIKLLQKRLLVIVHHCVRLFGSVCVEASLRCTCAHKYETSSCEYKEGSKTWTTFDGKCNDKTEPCNDRSHEYAQCSCESNEGSKTWSTFDGKCSEKTEP